MEELHYGGDPVEVVVLPALGARLHRLRAFGHDLLRTPEDPATHASDPYFWGAYVMAPWCNRIAPGPLTVEGRTLDLPSNFPDGSAIHGQVSTRSWRAEADGTLRIAGGGVGWPWTYEVIGRVAVDGMAVTLDYRLVNRSDGIMPAGIGLHPWFRRPVQVCVGATAVYPSNSGSPAGPVLVSGDLDLRSLDTPASGLDGTWVAPAQPVVTLAWPAVGLRATLEVDAPHVCIAIATPGAIDAIAVEPQTHGPEGLRRLLRGEPDALALVAPGEELGLGMRITVERMSAPLSHDAI